MKRRRQSQVTPLGAGQVSLAHAPAAPLSAETPPPAAPPAADAPPPPDAPPVADAPPPPPEEVPPALEIPVSIPGSAVVPPVAPSKESARGPGLSLPPHPSAAPVATRAATLTNRRM